MPQNLDLRVQRVDACAGTIAAAALPDLSARIWHIGPLTETDVELTMIARCAEPGGLVGMDVQGLTRVVIDGEVRARAPVERMDYLRHVGVLKADDAEILTYTGARDIETAVARCARPARASPGDARQRRRHDLRTALGASSVEAVPPRRSVDTTGCGDTFSQPIWRAGSPPTTCANAASCGRCGIDQHRGSRSVPAPLPTIAERRAALRRRT